MKTKDITNEVFGKLTVIKRDYSKSRISYSCLCECGNTKVIMKQSLLSGATKSCGCVIKRYNHPEAYDKKTYRLWHTMTRRCYNPKTNGHKHYSDKGIIVCNRWLGVDGFVNFMIDMGERISLGHTVDRIDNDGIYEPSNCRWATYTEQANNKSNNLPITIKGRTLNLCQWAREYNINSQTISERIKRGWEHDRAVTQKVKR